MGYQFAAVAACARAEIDDVVGAAYGFLVVLDYQHGVAEIAKFLQRFEQAAIVAVMQANGRLVEHIQHAAQLGTDLGRQANALALAAGERGRGAVKRKVV